MTKRLILLLVLAALAFALWGCPKPPPPPPPPPPQPVDTTPPTPPPPPPDTMKPQPPKLMESQFQTVYFDFDKFNLRPDARQGLDSNYTLLKNFPDVIVQIQGNCDERGTVEYNLSLGEKRAKAAEDYLTGLGIAPNRISIISYGKERPVDPRHTEEAWAKNRRCEFKIISQ